MKKTHSLNILILLLTLWALPVLGQGYSNCYFECQRLYPYQEGLDPTNHSAQVTSCVNDCERNQRVQQEQEELNQRIDEQEEMIEEQVDENQELESRIKQLEEEQEEMEFNQGP